MKKFLKIYWVYMQRALKYKWAYLGGIFFGIILVFFGNYVYFLIGRLIDNIIDGGDPVRPLFVIALVISLNLVLEPATFFLKQYIFSSVARDLIRDVYQRVMNLEYDFHINKETGKIISKVLQAQDLASTFNWNFEWFVFESFTTIIVPIALIFNISWEIGLGVLLAIVVALPFQILSLGKNIKRRLEVKEVDYDRNTAIIDGITNFETVNLFGSNKKEQGLLHVLMDKWFNATIRYQNTFRLIDFFARIGGILIFAVGGVVLVYKFNSGLLTIGMVGVIVTYLIKLSGQVMTLVFSFREVLKNIPIMEDVVELLETRSSLSYRAHTKGRIRGRVDIEINRITYQYSSGIDAIKDLNLDIKAGSTVAFVGPSGGGKTTLARLILRYFDVKNGAIKIDGINVKDYSKKDLQTLFGVVPQEPILFNRSIKYNIGYALSEGFDIPSKYLYRVIEAAKKAQIHDFILTLPEGYNTVVGERGIKLSGGQKQRVAIARVLLKKPEIVIFDEATSMLDSESERSIQKAFKELSKNTTTIIIAHRLSTIIHSDCIYVIDKGRITEQGRHEELLKLKGTYARLWSIQSGGFIKSKGE